MASTATLNLTGQVAGLPEGTVNISFSTQTTVASYSVTLLNITTTPSAVCKVAPSSAARYLLLVPSTASAPWRIASDTAEIGQMMSSAGFCLQSLTGTATTQFLWTTGGTTFTMRVITF